MADADRLQRLRRLAAWLLVGAVAVVAVAGSPAADEPPAAAAPPPFPLDEFLSYNVSYLGIHCGAMTLSSFTENQDGTPIYRIDLAARSSKFFDGVYRVRVRIESTYSAERSSSLSYHQYGEEKGEHKDELWQVDFSASEVHRTRNGKLTIISLSTDGVVDPLSFVYRMRVLLSGAGERATLAMMTSGGAVETVAEVVEKRTIKTPFGAREVLVVVPRPRQEELFSRKGKMEIWVGADERRLPYRIVFDLPFGKLIARLEAVADRANGRDLLADDGD
jgi:hypothetical protein